MKPVRYVVGLAAVLTAPHLMRLALSSVTDPSLRPILLPVCLAVSGVGLALMLSNGFLVHGALTSGITRLNLSGSGWQTPDPAVKGSQGGGP